MKTFIIYLTFIPWLLYFVSVTKNDIKDLKGQKVNLRYVKENFLKIFHLDMIILIAIFVFFCKYYKTVSQIWLVKVLLFSAINLYLYTNTYYDKNKSHNIIGTEDISTILIMIILILIPLTFYAISNHYTITYYILFGYSFFHYILSIISKTINDKIIQLVRRKNHEK